MSASQLQQIQFANPAGFAACDYSAPILSTGEIVPGAAQNPTLSAMRIPKALVLGKNGFSGESTESYFRN
ncbi:MAG TPA: hypothetical protein VLT36_25470 [Candidatus Dormibacteraeota bacterium]|nr:hypothetical protein [Candidatus Dormibacteraeota bacterium]